MKISVLTASYNYARYIGETIESVLAQTFTDWEMIIVDDGSSDNSLEVIQTYAQKDPRIKVFTHPDGKNHGLAATLQLGLEKAQGEWIAFLESDDQFTPTSLEEKLAVVQQHPEVVLVFTDAEVFGEKKQAKILEIFNKNARSLTCPCKMGPRFLQRNYILSFSVVMVQKERILKCDFDSPFQPWLDYYLWAQLSSEFMFYLDRKLTRWRLHSDSYGQKSNLSFYAIFRLKERIRELVYPRGGWKSFVAYLKNIYFLHRLLFRVHLFQGEVVFCGKEFRWK